MCKQVCIKDGGTFNKFSFIQIFPDPADLEDRDLSLIIRGKTSRGVQKLQYWLYPGIVRDLSEPPGKYEEYGRGNFQAKGNGNLWLNGQ